MTDGLRIAHPQDCPLEGNPEVGNPEGNLFIFFFMIVTSTIARKCCDSDLELLLPNTEGGRSKVLMLIMMMVMVMVMLLLILVKMIEIFKNVDDSSLH